MADAKARPVRKYDAVLAPSSYPKNKTGPARNQALKAEFAKDFASPHVYWTHVGPDQILITPEPSQTRYHNTESVLGGEERYEWTDRGDGILIGLLTEEARVTDEERDSAEQNERQAKIGERQKQVEARMAELAKTPDAQRTTEENAELAKLRRFAAAMFGGKPVPLAQPSGAVPGSAKNPGPSGGAPVAEAATLAKQVATQPPKSSGQ